MDGGNNYNLYRKDLHYFWFAADDNSLFDVYTRFRTDENSVLDLPALIDEYEPEFIALPPYLDPDSIGIHVKYGPTGYMCLFQRED